MHLPAENIAQHLFKTISVQNISDEQLQQIINDYPFYGATYFLSAKKMFSLKEKGYENALQKAAVHFSNDLWLHFNLTGERENYITENKIKAQSVESALEAEENTIKTTLPDVVEAGEEKFIEEDIVENNSSEILNEIRQKQIETVENFAEGPQAIIEPDKSIPGENQTNDVGHLTEDRLDYNDEENVQEHYSEADAAVNERLSSILKEQAAAFEKPGEAPAEISIENTPYHRIDYFDSQGIKLEEKETTDKLGTQLKRFTEWLKQMKRVNTNAAEMSNDEAGEKKVQQIAEHANESEEIITETMAEVLIKQGKPEQAIQVYEKLSFNNPSKSAYFAAKIEELKG